MVVIEERVRKNYNKLTKSCQKIADFLLSNMEDATFFDISEFGREVGVSESTVMRFVRGIGYDGFPKMQEDLRHRLREQITPIKKMEQSVSRRSQDIYNNILETDLENLENLKKTFKHERLEGAVNTILNARQVYIIGYRTSFPLAYLLAMFLTQIMKNTIILDMGGGEIYDRIIGLGKEDLLIAVSFPRYSRITMEIADYAKGKGCKIIGISDSVLSPIGKIADIVLTAECKCPMFFNSYVAGLSVINCISAGIALKVRRSIPLLKKRDQVFKQLGVLLK